MIAVAFSHLPLLYEITALCLKLPPYIWKLIQKAISFFLHLPSSYLDLFLGVCRHHTTILLLVLFFLGQVTLPKV